MPITYNGVGTRYVGRRNAESRPGVCQHCRRSVNLTSYDTRLWFVVLYIPVIPLVRKRIIDQCSSCRRHYVMPLDEWEASKQLSISGAMGEFREDPTPEKAVAAHRQLLVFHQSAQAEEFGQTMATQFPESTNVLLYLGHASNHLGRGNCAADFFRRALELRPDLPEARLAVAEGLVAQGKPDEARTLLDFLEQPGAARVYSAAPLERLANGYQKAGRHPEALELYGKVLREAPTAAQHAGFRKRVRISEKASGQRESILPKKRFSWRSAFQRDSTGGGGKRTLLVGAVALLLISLGLAGSNLWTSRHRTLYFVNAYAQSATVQIAGLAPVTVPPHGRAALALAEGHYHAAVTGPVSGEADFNLKALYLERWLSHPAWVFNVGGNAILMLQKVHYSYANVPTEVSFYTGQNCHFFPGVDHPFEALPKSVQVESTEREKVLSNLQMLPLDTASLAQELVSDKRNAQALELCEDRLRAFPDEPGLASTYLNAAVVSQQTPRARDTLQAGLARRPVNIAWHRAYQTAARLGTRDVSSLQAEYDTLVAGDPNNSALLYLRGRLCGQPNEADGYFARAIAADEKNPWPLFASAYNHVLAGDWKAARPLAEHAEQLSPDSPEMANLFFETRLALGEASALAAGARQRLQKAPLDATALIRLTDALSTDNRREESRQMLEDWCLRARGSHAGGSLDEAINRVRYYVLYSLGDFEQLEQETNQDQSVTGRSAHLQALVEEGKLPEAAALLDRTPLGEDKAAYLLAVSIAGAAKGDVALAEDYRHRAREAFEKQGSTGASAATLLAKTGVSSPADFASFDLDLDSKRTLLVSAALQASGTAAGAGDARLGGTLNVSRTFPYHLLVRVTHGDKAK